MKGIVKGQLDLNQLQTNLKSQYSNNPLALKYLNKAFNLNQESINQLQNQNADPNPTLSAQYAQLFDQLKNYEKIQNYTFQVINNIFNMQGQIKQEYNKVKAINDKLKQNTRNGQLIGTNETMDLVQKLEQSKQLISDTIHKIQAESEKLFDTLQGIS
jgi:DNA-binding XRE family transcriptional regulator